MRQYLTILSGLIIITAVFLAGAWGLFDLTDSVFYDYCVRFSPEKNRTGADILLIESPGESVSHGDETWLTLLRALGKNAPEKIMFAFTPPKVSPAFYQTARQYGNVIFGRSLIESPGTNNDPIFAPLPESAAGRKLHFGITSLPPSYHGIHRGQYAWVMAEGDMHPVFEYAAIYQKGQREKIPPHAPLYGVNFNGKFNGLPTISLTRALDGDMVSSLVKEKHVIIGFKKSPLESGLHTPFSPEKGISMLLFQGFALDTLLSGETIREVDFQLKLLLLSVTVLMVFLLSAFLNIRLFTWFALPMCGIIPLVCWVGFTRFYIRLPASELITGYFSSVVFIILWQAVRQEKNIRRLILQMSVKLRENIIPESFYDSEDPWSYIITMINQNLNLSRSILLEAVKGDHRVREIKALNCSLEDIFERRRDFQREPYSLAIRDSTVIRIERRNYFKKIGKEEIQYLAPLTFAGRVLGFWAFAIMPETRVGIRNFNFIISDFAGRVGELLYRWEHKRRRNISKWRKIANHLLPSTLSAEGELGNALALMSRRMDLSDTAFDSTGSAIIMYDHFGQILHMNRKMNRLMTESGFLPYEMKALDFVTRVTPASLDETRGLFRRFLYNRKAVTLTAVLPNATNKHYMMSIRTLFSEKDSMPGEFSYPFHTYGILLELVEVTDIRMFNKLKNKLLSALDYRLRKDFEPVLLAGSLLSRGDLPEKRRDNIKKVLDRRILGMLAYIRRTESSLDEDIFMSGSKEYSIDLRSLLKEAVEKVEGHGEKGKISFQLEMPETQGLICINHNALLEIISAVLILLIDDAMEKTTIQIDMIQTGTEYIINFENIGFGMPDSLLKSYLFEKKEVASPEFTRLKRGVNELKRWGGLLDASSEMGVGTHFTIHLESTICESPQ